MNSARDLVLGTAGHIDHGKTSLVRALTGVDTDRLPQEKQRGITIDLGYAALDLGETRLALVDVPGHERFIRNMLAGATAIDLALLVIASDDSVMPQTREHLQILELLGVRAGVIALTKCDLVDSAWVDLVESEVRALVEHTFLADAPIVRTSAPSGVGIDALREALATAARDVGPADDPGLFRLAIDRAFAVEGHGTVVTGTVASGSVAVGDELELWPAGLQVRVRGIQRHDQAVEAVGRGTRAALNLAGVHHSQVTRGHELATPGYLQPSRLITAELEVSGGAVRPLRHRQRYSFHAGTTAIPARVHLLDERSELKPGESAIGQIVLAAPTTAVFAQAFVLRDESPAVTIGGGHVLEPTARRVRRRDAIASQHNIGTTNAPPIDRLERAMRRERLRTLENAALVRETGLTIPALAAAREQMRDDGRLVVLSLGASRRAELPVATAEALEARVVREIAKRHASNPRLSVLPRGSVAGGLGDLASEALVGALIERLRAAGKVVGDSNRIALAGHRATLSQNEARIKEKLRAAIAEGQFSPPIIDELAQLAQRPAAVVTELLALLVDEGQICPIGGGLWLSANAESQMRDRVRAYLSVHPEGMAMSDLRDLLQTSRKYAVPIGEYLDRVGVTRRDGDRRMLAARAETHTVTEHTAHP